MSTPATFSSGVLRFSAFSLLLVASFAARAQDPFAEGVRPTNALAPEDERKGFVLPPDFEIKLFAAEPSIAKPMNMAFDDRGRLWVTTTLEYPFPAPLDKKGRDSIVILEDKDGDGKAETVSTFVDGLNIPTGIYPYKNGVIAWSIPNLWYFEDTDGDGKADKRTVLFGPLGWERDTHGMNSSFRRGLDGWLYITHGFNNNSLVKAPDGTQIQMNSGNVYRIQVDGSSVQQYSWGQVNPFGLTFDPLGNLFSADCHSAPIYQLLRDAYYPSFGKPHDGLGFGPTLMEHSHGSTAIAGIVYISDDRWPQGFRDNIIIGNVMTSRINRDTLVENGTTKVAHEEPDFLIAKDPWFRPVDMQFGPDGALYVADFYNKIIGHYEVPLTHPGRDRDKGRIWRISYKNSSRRTLDFPKASVDSLLEEIGDSNQTRRYLATEQLVQRGASKVAKPIKDLWKSEEVNWRQKAHGLWILHRVGALDTALMKLACSDPSREVRTHAQRVLSESAAWTPELRLLAERGLSDRDPWVQRAAADALNRHPAAGNIAALLRLRARVPASDPTLLHGVRMALRSQLKAEGAFASLPALKLSDKDRSAIADVAVAVPTPEAAAFLLEQLQQVTLGREDQERFVRHVARYGDAARQETLAEMAPQRFKEDLDMQLSLFRAVQSGAAQRGAALGDRLKSWGGTLARALASSSDPASIGWRNVTIEGMANRTAPWFLQARPSSDGRKDAVFISSLPPGGESLTGVYTSVPFDAPGRLRFFLAGHDGYPDKPAQKRNAVRLRDGSTSAVIMEAAPPRNDIAKPVEWDLTAVAGRKVYLELVDADTGDAYAWLAAGRFEAPVPPFPVLSPKALSDRLSAAAELAGSLGLGDLAPRFANLLSSDRTDLEARAALARSLALLKPTDALTTLSGLLAENTVPVSTRTRLASALAGDGDPYSVVFESLESAPYRVQAKLVQTLAGNAAAARRFLELAESGKVSPRLLQDRLVAEKLKTSLGASGASRVSALTKTLGAGNEALIKLIEQRRAGYVPTSAQPTLGVRLFNQSCAPCHQIDGRGGNVGPQLDGIGNRGVERLCEDILDPNRNVDVAFRSHLFVLKDGDVVSGLPRREEGETVVIADATGKEQVILKKSIQERRQSDVSLMPENFGELLSQEDFNHLLAYLLSKGSTGK